ncbi:MAG: DUF4276 family protein [Nitrospirae bacterium]|nr:DUF4276 family protein [Magnetococcales bacterium]HAT50488.1 hypothetical protein [Alphaproteobacteria bacterium]
MQLVFFLEEASAKALLQELLPRFLPNIETPLFIVFEGKQDLEKQLTRKLRNWQCPKSCFVVLRDKDSGNCYEIKEKLRKLSHESGHPQTLIRIACRELESWYLGDLAAVEQALNARGAVKQQANQKFRNPDKLGNPVQELMRLAPSYQKISGSRAMGKVMKREGNTSHSFNVFIKGIISILKS